MQALTDGHLDVFDTIFASIGAPPPVLKWSPSDDDVPQRRLRFLNGYWNARVHDGALPNSAGIDPLDLAPALGYLMLLEPLEGGADQLYRLYGTRISEYSRMDMTGRRLWEIPYSVVAFYFAATYRAVMIRREALYALHATHPDMVVPRWARLILPFHNTAGQVNRLLVGNIPSPDFDTST